MNPIKTFLLEPIYSGELLSYPSWDNRALKGWRNPITGIETEWPHQQDVGAMWRAAWLPKGFVWENETEAHLIVKTPGGDWDIDNRASNCTLPNDKVHRCWVRHGEPPNVDVNKSGITCNAGAGSIVIGNWHGFLRNGYLVA
jgi:hypothetical protein